MLVRQVMPETHERIWPKETGFSEKRSADGVRLPEEAVFPVEEVVVPIFAFGEALGETLPILDDADLPVAPLPAPATWPESPVNLMFLVSRYLSKCSARAW